MQDDRRFVHFLFVSDTIFVIISTYKLEAALVLHGQNPTQGLAMWD